MAIPVPPFYDFEWSDISGLFPKTIAAILSDHDKATHDALNIDADKVDGEEAAAIVTDARVKAHFPDTIANILSDHDLTRHALAIIPTMDDGHIPDLETLSYGAAFALAQIPFAQMAEVTISGGSITITGLNNTVDTEGDAATDNLDTITFTGVVDGQIITLRTANAARDVTVRDAGVSGGNIHLVDNVPWTLSHPRDRIMLQWHSPESVWVELTRSNIV